MCQLLIVIGLPGSGKSTYCSYFKDRLIIDDFLNTMFNGDLIKYLKEGKKIIINDPRLCIKKTFLRTMTQLERLLDRKDICLFLMLVGIDQCRLNIMRRHEDGDIRNVEKNLEYMYTQYDLNNYNGYSKRFVI
jgi:hypothetical protein